MCRPLGQPRLQILRWTPVGTPSMMRPAPHAWEVQKAAVSKQGLSQAVAERCSAGDTLMFYFSGHGGQRTDYDGDESDGLDEVLCLTSEAGDSEPLRELIAAQERLQRESIELQNMLMALEQELGEQHNKLLEAMYKNSQGIVERLADELGLDMVLVRDPMTVIYASDGLDITEVVVAEYDRAYPE